MSLARDLIDAALAADLSQNELRVFLALFRQTLCYGKATDSITFKRLADLTHIRKDRLKPAVDAIVNKQLFEAVEHPYFDATYTVSVELLEKHNGVFFTPSLPKIGTFSRESDDLPENRVSNTTKNNLTSSYLTTTTTEGHSRDFEESDLAPLHYPAELSATEQRQAAKTLDGLTLDNAQACLSILGMKIKAGEVKSPIGLLYRLAERAKLGTLDKSILNPPHKAELITHHSANAVLLRELLAEIQGIDSLAKLAGGAMDNVITAKRHQLIKHYKRLREESLHAH